MTISKLRGELPSFEPAPTLALRPVSPERSPETVNTFVQALRGLGHEIDVGEVQVARASRLQNYDTGTLIALQAGIYRYTEAVDLASKIIDRATSAVHTVLQTGGH